MELKFQISINFVRCACCLKFVPWGVFTVHPRLHRCWHDGAASWLRENGRSRALASGRIPVIRATCRVQVVHAESQRNGTHGLTPRRAPAPGPFSLAAVYRLAFQRGSRPSAIGPAKAGGHAYRGMPGCLHDAASVPCEGGASREFMGRAMPRSRPSRSNALRALAPLQTSAGSMDARCP